MPSLGYQVDLWVDGQEVRIGKQGAVTGGVAVPMSAIGAELARTPSGFAFWGRGTMFGPAGSVVVPNVPGLPAEALMAIRGLGMLNELGGSVRVDNDTLKVTLVVRTAWSNPDDVVAKLEAIKPQGLFDGTAATAAKAIAAASPGLPFAADYKAGTGGLMAPMAVAGMLAAVAVPAFLDYMHKSKRVEAQVVLDRLDRAAKAYYAEHGALPVADAPLTPPAPCCQGPRGRCEAAGAGWLDEAWTQLDFQIEDSTLFQYRYHADGKTLDAEAIGDLDCDGTTISYRLHVDTQGGNTTSVITPPPPNTD